ncbi:cytochrome-c peroxidase [Leptospira perolatii]|uniref:Methylamine utilization protein MauG n=1 Tax=Leptospira perolatii TaxID=2023191 RepID=A0A2M9ZNL2_9LEPT|nr:cytochrome c peroxidase [Leptospira perolatii]PJZ69618.1 cytochrome-c peroxidase [Leptospira perolatii]PJZ73605.1 cytochrome-c peroxidase [Leptospira perolatii]
MNMKYASFAFSLLLWLGSLNYCKPEPRPIPELEKFVVKNVIHPSSNPYNPDKIELGKYLYFDPRLSLKQDTSCASCHNSELQNLNVGTPRNKIHNQISPKLTNVALYKDVFQDPHAKDLEDIVKDRLHSEIMLKNESVVLQRLSAIPKYRELFKKAFGSEEVTTERIVLALSAFERTIVSKNSRFDRFVMGDSNALTDAQKRGWEVFQNKAKCVQCHKGPNFSDSKPHAIGLSGVSDKMRTPTLRDVTRKKAFMHNGEFTSIEEAVDHFTRGGQAGATKDPLLKPSILSEEEKKDLIEFLRALEGETIQLEIPEIPKA